MNRTAKIITAALLVLSLAVLLAACAKQAPKHPLVAKWTQDFDDGSTRVMFSFEAVGDTEICVWRADETGALVQSEFYTGAYSFDETSSTLTLKLDELAVDSISFSYVLDGDSLTLTNAEHTLALTRAQENSGKTK